MENTETFKRLNSGWIELSEMGEKIKNITYELDNDLKELIKLFNQVNIKNDVERVASNLDPYLDGVPGVPTSFNFILSKYEGHLLDLDKRLDAYRARIESQGEDAKKVANDYYHISTIFIEKMNILITDCCSIMGRIKMFVNKAYDFFDMITDRKFNILTRTINLDVTLDGLKARHNEIELKTKNLGFRSQTIDVFRNIEDAIYNELARRGIIKEDDKS